MASDSPKTQPATAATRRSPSPSFAEFDRRARAGQPMSVVFFGGSLTWGANASDPQTTSYRARMAQYLQSRYPNAPFSFHDAAIGGTGSKLGIFRLERDVLSRQPDLVFLDFTANDDLSSRDLPTLASYECLLREMIGRGIPVMQVFLGFRHNFSPGAKPETLPRVLAHKELATAYRTGVGDCFPLIQQRLQDSTTTLQTLWPFDGAHPGDAGYELFFEAVRDGFSQAVAQNRNCIVPPKPVFSDAYLKRTRIRLADRPLPAGWTTAKTYRTALWFDGLSSRWLGDVALCSAGQATSPAPLTVPFEGTFVALLGEADQDGLSFKVSVDGKPLFYRDNSKAPPTEIWPWNTQRLGTGRLLMWRQLSDSLAPGRHTLVIEPVFPTAPGKGELRIESVCAAGM